MKVMEKLFGIHNSNRTDSEHLGKNQFNSSFPTALANYMNSKKVDVMYNKLAKDKEGNLKVVTETIPVADLFGEKDSNNLFFSFETIFEPYQELSYDKIDCIDLAVKNMNNEWLRALEVKLTVLPDKATSEDKEENWGSEMVVRSATTQYCAFGMYDKLKDKKIDIHNIFDPYCSKIGAWDNDFEVTSKYSEIQGALEKFEKNFYQYQQPLLMQTIWKTNGQSPELKEDAFDIIVWSDYAISRLFIDRKIDSHKMTRPMRATVKLARCLWELSKSGKIHINEIYRKMAFGTQTDKEFSINGKLWRNFITNKSRIKNPIIKRTEIKNILSEDTIRELKPERRFDQTLYFTYKNS